MSQASVTLYATMLAPILTNLQILQKGCKNSTENLHTLFPLSSHLPHLSFLSTLPSSFLFCKCVHALLSVMCVFFIHTCFSCGAGESIS